VRVLGIQEPMSVLFSLLNLWAHAAGLRKLRSSVSPQYPLRAYYERLAHIGIAAWICSSVFHTRDFTATEELDYFAAGASVLYGLYYAAVRIFRLDGPGSGRGEKRRRNASLLRIWTWTCRLLYLAHVLYLKGVKWDYTYNMTANVVVGALHNALWSWYSWKTYRMSRRAWAAWPGMIVAWVVLAMSLELLDFPPLWGSLDAHALWHAATVIPTIIWYK
jgi:post-GPI attachment to proteins factor 3